MRRPTELPRFLALILLLLSIQQNVSSFSFTDCGVSRNCWFHPPTCEQNRQSACDSGVEWFTDGAMLKIRLESRVTDLDQTRPFYVALGFSLNQKMGDDTVVECIVPVNGSGGFMQISFNDGTFNEALPQASKVLISDGVTTLIDGFVTCEGTYHPNNVMWVRPDNQFMIHDLSASPYYLLFARGSADAFSFAKDIHSVNDGAQFPYISNEQVSFCFNGTCANTFHQLKDSSQSEPVSRYWRYRIAVIHGIIMMFAWWVLGSTAVLLARYFKPLFPRTKLLGTAVWFQLHRDLWIISLILQLVMVILIFYQAGWVWYECTYKCTSDDFSKKMHVITGVLATALACIQPLLAFIRPSPSSPRRPWFNWTHWAVGMSAWTLAAATVVFGIPMGKTGLNAVFGHAPNYIVAGYIIFFVVCVILFEMMISRSDVRIDKNGSSGMALAHINGPSVESPLAATTNSSSRVLLLLLHVVVALAVTITFAVMLIKILLSHSP